MKPADRQAAKTTIDIWARSQDGSKAFHFALRRRLAEERLRLTYQCWVTFSTG